MTATEVNGSGYYTKLESITTSQYWSSTSDAAYAENSAWYSDF
jgi:hypothetical protein